MERYRWRSVDEALPDEDGALWDVLTTEGGETQEFYHFFEGWATDETVTHWRPKT